MDSSQLTTIAITAVISVTCKEVATWSWALLKNIVTTATIKERLRIIFSKSNLRIFYDLSLITFYLYILASTGWTDRPLSGKDVLIVIGSIAVLIFMLTSLLFDIFNARTEAKNKR